VLTVRPRRWVKLGIGEHELPEIGVFASDSPHRPNPIAVTIVELLAVEGRRLKVRGLDLYNGTPVLDIKPYTFSRRVNGIRVPDWYDPSPPLEGGVSNLWVLGVSPPVGV
jgi:tRNA (Thr-GGU) A37 N-methylase